MKYRNLTDSEITALHQQGCTCDNWSKIQVKAGFRTENIRNVRFKGDVRVGKTGGKVEVEKGIYKTCGIYNSYIRNCTIDDNVYIAQVQNLINYDIQKNAILENIGTLVVTGEPTFGNGVVIDVLNEAGGRELAIFEDLTAQIAYLAVTYRHDSHLQRKLRALIGKYVESKKSKRGSLGRDVKIVNSISIRNVNIGPYANIAGVASLENGTIVSVKEDPVYVGVNVVAKNFIIQTGSEVDDGAIVENCFIGQSVSIGHQFSATHSCFFTNSEGYHGEACSIFAGPYTVTHHKSTLLIAGLFSFYNAGSGTNQSNHMYKLGPVHQGIVERGCKTGSFSYLLWPSRIGAFTAVIGKHFINFDSSDLPFSYINEVGGKSVLTPAMNLITVGTRRDSEKWPSRDKRRIQRKLDLITYDLLSPYTVIKLERGSEILSQLYEGTSHNQEYVHHNGLQINRLMLKTCKKYYDMAVKIFIGNQVVKQLKSGNGTFSIDILRDIPIGANERADRWIDAAGFVAPAASIDDMLNDIVDEKITSIEEVDSRLQEIYKNGERDRWEFTVHLIRRRLGVEIKDITVENVLEILEDWKSNSIKLDNMILKDAQKEYTMASHYGFGIDGNEITRQRDFEAVRGSVETNAFMLELRKEIKDIEQTYGELVDLIKAQQQ